MSEAGLSGPTPADAEMASAQAILQQWTEVANDEEGKIERIYAQIAKTWPLGDHSEFQENVEGQS